VPGKKHIYHNLLAGEKRNRRRLSHPQLISNETWKPLVSLVLGPIVFRILPCHWHLALHSSVPNSVLFCPSPTLQRFMGSALEPPSRHSH